MSSSAWIAGVLLLLGLLIPLHSVIRAEGQNDGVVEQFIDWGILDYNFSGYERNEALILGGAVHGCSEELGSVTIFIYNQNNEIAYQRETVLQGCDFLRYVPLSSLKESGIFNVYVEYKDQRDGPKSFFLREPISGFADVTVGAKNRLAGNFTMTVITISNANYSTTAIWELAVFADADIDLFKLPKSWRGEIDNGNRVVFYTLSNPIEPGENSAIRLYQKGPPIQSFDWVAYDSAGLEIASGYAIVRRW